MIISQDSNFDYHFVANSKNKHNQQICFQVNLALLAWHLLTCQICRQKTILWAELSAARPTLSLNCWYKTIHLMTQMNFQQDLSLLNKISHRQFSLLTKFYQFSRRSFTKNGLFETLVKQEGLGYVLTQDRSYLLFVRSSLSLDQPEHSSCQACSNLANILSLGYVNQQTVSKFNYQGLSDIASLREAVIPWQRVASMTLMERFLRKSNLRKVAAQLDNWQVFFFREKSVRQSKFHQRLLRNALVSQSHCEFTRLYIVYAAGLILSISILYHASTVSAMSWFWSLWFTL
jgi:hypothetical protein